MLSWWGLRSVAGLSLCAGAGVLCPGCAVGIVWACVRRFKLVYLLGVFLYGLRCFRGLWGLFEGLRRVPPVGDIRQPKPGEGVA